MKLEVHLQEDELKFMPSEIEVRRMIAFALDEADLKKGVEKIVIEPATDIVEGQNNTEYDKVLLGYRVQRYDSQFCWDRYISRSQLG